MPELIVKLRDRELSRVPILRQTTRIGRGETNDVVIDNPGVSRHHATVRFDRGTFSVKDEGSQNGIFVNGDLVATSDLTGGDIIKIGKFDVIFSEGAGVPVHKLIRDQPILVGMTDEAPKVQTSLNPQETMALSPADIDRLIGGLSDKAEARLQERRPPQAVPQRYVHDDAGVKKQLEALRYTVIGLAVLVIALLGVVLYFALNT